MKTFYLPSVGFIPVQSYYLWGLCDNFPRLPNRLEMIGDLKAMFLLNRLLDPKIRFVQIGGDSENWGSDDSNCW